MSINRDDAAFLFARNAVRTTYEDLPASVIELTKKGILDTTGVILPASSTSSDAKKLVEIIRDIGGKKESTILGFGGKVPAWHAGYVNGAMANCLDYSDLHPTAAHINSPVLPAAIAMAERLGGVSGKQFITAVALGVDLQCRLTLAAGYEAGKLSGWHPAPLFGVFGATLACSKLLDLDEDQTINALGIAFTQAAGTLEIVLGKDSNIRGIGHAVPGEVGVRSAIMAQRGITGVRNSFEGNAGLMNIYFRGDYERSILVGDLGSRYDVLNDGFKPWPSCGFTHIYIDMIRELRREHGLEPEQVESITLVVGDFARGQTEPLEEWRRPSNPMLAKLSLPFTAAVAMQKGNVLISDFLEEALDDAAVLDMAGRVKSRFNSDYNFNPGIGLPAGELEILTKDGHTYSRKQKRAHGHPEKPMSWDDLAAKFRDCAAYSANRLPEENVDRAIQMLSNLEQVSDVGHVFALLG